jgi:DNA invertase Pin-like site-specific DNA recombinase
MISGMKIGYARVSKDEQDLAPQLRALDAAGCEKVFQDQGWSGASAARPGLLAALEMAGEGDTLAVWRIDRLGRSTLHLLQILEDLHRRNIAFSRSWTESTRTRRRAAWCFQWSHGRI